MIKKFLGRLLGSDKVIEGAINGIDKIWYTAEEKAEDVEKARIAKSEFFIDYLKATTNSALARRVLAFMLVGQFMLTVNIWLGVSIYAIFNPSENLVAVTDLLWLFIGKFVTLVMLILSFYFGPQQFAKLIDAWNAKK